MSDSISFDLLWICRTASRTTCCTTNYPQLIEVMESETNSTGLPQKLRSQYCYIRRSVLLSVCLSVCLCALLIEDRKVRNEPNFTHSVFMFSALIGRLPHFTTTFHLAVRCRTFHKINVESLKLNSKRLLRKQRKTLGGYLFCRTW